MSEEKLFNRWWVVVGALVIQVSLGAVYIWSVFQKPLQAFFPGWTERQVTLPSMIVLAAFALAIIFGGRFQDRLGPRIVATVGGVVLGAGLILARFTGSMSPGLALFWLILTFSVLGGIGIGLAYVCPIATCVKWFPDKRGLITGLAVAGFGAGAFFFGPLAKGLIAGAPYALLGLQLFPLPKIGVFNTFTLLGLVFLVAVVIGAQLLRNPPAGFVPAGWAPPAAKAGTPSKVDFTPTEMLSTWNFWVLWLTYAAGCLGGLMIIMKASPIWESWAMAKETPPVAEAIQKGIGVAGGLAVSILAIFNAAGRIGWGKVSDNLGRKWTLIVMFLLSAVALFALNSLQTFPLYVIGIGIVGLCFGGYLALYPAVTADYFGTKHIGFNYGWMFTAYGVGGLAGPYLAAWLMKPGGTVPYTTTNLAGETVEKVFALGDYRLGFLVAGVLCVLAGILCFFIHPPKARAAA